jgi:hypothetical protein
MKKDKNKVKLLETLYATKTIIIEANALDGTFPNILYVNPLSQ